MKRLTVAILTTLFAMNLMAQTNVQIVGTAADAIGKTVELYGYDDMLSGREVLLADARIDSNGHFRLGCYVNYPRLVFMQVERYSQSFYIEAGQRYEVYIPDFEWDIDERVNVHLSPVALPVEFVGLEPDELNMRLSRFDTVVDSFVAANRVWFDVKFHPQKRYFDTLTTALRHMGILSTDAEPQTFYDRYVEYSLAEMRLAMHFESRKKLIGRYITGQTVRYWDEPYMRLFLELYKGAISKGTSRIPLSRLVSWVENGNLERYLDTIGLDPLMQNEQVRELAVLEALKESFYNPAYTPEKVRDMVRQLGQRTRFKEHREIAAHLNAMMSERQRGGEVADFRLPDVDRNMVSLDDMRGKWVYLSFVRVGEAASQKEIETLAFFRDSIYAKNPDVVFVSVSCDREFQKMYHFLKTGRRGKRYNWTWLHFDGNYKLLENYGVVSYPTFLLINPEGRLHYNITPMPASGILLHGPWEKKTEKQDTDKPFFMR